MLETVDVCLRSSNFLVVSLSRNLGIFESSCTCLLEYLSSAHMLFSFSFLYGGYWYSICIYLPFSILFSFLIIDVNINRGFDILQSKGKLKRRRKKSFCLNDIYQHLSTFNYMKKLTETFSLKTKRNINQRYMY